MHEHDVMSSSLLVMAGAPLILFVVIFLWLPPSILAYSFHERVVPAGGIIDSKPTHALAAPNECFKLLRNADSTKSQRRHITHTLNAIIGMGWDDLRHMGTSPVFETGNYTHCRVTPDGEFLLPDGVVAVPMLRSYLDNKARAYFSHRDYERDVTRHTGMDVNLGFSVSENFKVPGDISGGYATKNQDVKKKMFKHASILLRTTLTYYAYKLLADEGERQLSRGFAMRIKELSKAVRHKLNHKATLLAELLVRDYGTHVVTKAEVGAIIEQEDYIRRDVWTTDSKVLDEIRVAAGLSFSLKLPKEEKQNATGDCGDKAAKVELDVMEGITDIADQDLKFQGHLKLNFTYNDTNSENEWTKYSKSLRDSTLRTTGGPNVNELLRSWNISEGKRPRLVENVVPLDRKGIPLSDLLVPLHFPHYPLKHLGAMHSLVQRAIYDYFAHNTVYGCTDPDAPNYYFAANTDDGTCRSHYENFIFGGIYQTCEPVGETEGWVCRDYEQVNVVTGSTACPDNFHAEEILTSSVKLPTRTEPVKWYDFGTYAACLKDDAYILYKDLLGSNKSVNHLCKSAGYVSAERVFLDWVKLSSYACYPDDNTKQDGVLFGGAYSDVTGNPLTGLSTCPGNFQPNRIGTNAHVCISVDYDDRDTAVHVAFFFSCEQQRKCPAGYSLEQFANRGSTGDCPIYYCLRRPELRRDGQRLQPIRRPPYTNVSYLFDERPASAIQLYLNNEPLVDKSLSQVLSLADRERVHRYDNDTAVEVAESDVSLDEKIRIFLNATIPRLTDYIQKHPHFMANYMDAMRKGTEEQRQDKMAKLWKAIGLE